MFSSASARGLKSRECFIEVYILIIKVYLLLYNKHLSPLNGPMVGNCDIYFFVFRHHNHIMSGKFLKFERV
jgi:hypothetical protein